MAAVLKCWSTTLHHTLSCSFVSGSTDFQTGWAQQESDNALWSLLPQQASDCMQILPSSQTLSGYMRALLMLLGLLLSMPLTFL